MSEHKALAQQTEQMAVPYVSVIHATPIDADSEMVLPGTLKPYVESPIYARTNGYLKKWYKDIGSHVEKGELLAEIDTPEIDQQLAQARADLVTAQANLSLSTLTATRYQDLIKVGFRFPARPRQCQRRPRRQAGHGAIGRRQRQAPGRDGILQACVRPLYGNHHAAECRSRHAHQCRKWRDGHQGNVRFGADRSDARLCGRAAVVLSFHPISA